MSIEKRNKILIVEDESIIALNIKKILQQKNYTVLDILPSGEKAINSLKKDIPDLILMDINLSGELNGIQTYENIKKNYNIPIIYLTALSSEKIMQRAKLTGPYGYIVKPINSSELINTIEIALFKSAMENKLKIKNQELENTIKELEKRNQECDLKNKQIIQAQHELTEKENQFKLIFENSRDAICLSKDGFHVMINKAYLDLFAYQNENQLVGAPISKITSSNENSPLKKYLSSETDPNLDHYNMIGQKQDGTDFLMEIYISKYKTDQGVFILYIIRDITKQMIEAESNQNIMQKLALHIEQTPLGVIEWDINGRVTAWNKAAQKIFKYSKKEAIGKHARNLIIPEDHIKQPTKTWKKLLAQKGGTRSTDKNIAKNGKNLICEWYNTPLVNKEGKVIGVASLVQDITKRIDTEEKIKNSLHEKESLLKEIHHRVKNNMQVISSLINLQKRQIKDPFDKMLLQETENRIRSIALVHEKLYKSKNMAKIEFSDYIKTFLKDIAHTYNKNGKKIKTNIKISNISLGIELAIPCGLIINELVANSFIHAFKDKSRGTITIEFNHTKKDIYILSIADDGEGLPQQLDFSKQTTLGLQLVQALTQQLCGYLDIKKSKGTKFRITFPKK